MDIIPLRLRAHHLASEKFQSPEEVVKTFGAMQAQDFPGAKWSLGIRVDRMHDEEIEKPYNEGKILRTHVMRPTWHLVLPEDIFWMQKLTSGNVKKLMGHYNRKLELDDKLFKKSNAILVSSLRNNNFLTRQEIKKILEEARITTDVQRLAHIIMWAELDGLICSGPLRQRVSKTKARGQVKGGQFTYALTEERVPKVKHLSREGSLSALAQKYLQSHGPAQLGDFSWWSGFSLKESTEAFTNIKSKLEQETLNGKTYWFLRGLVSQHTPHTVFLVSVYDEYFIGYTDRSDVLDESHKKQMASVGNALLTSLIILDGKVAGTWKRVFKKDFVEIKLNMFRTLTDKEKNALEQAAYSYAEFFGHKGKVV